MCVIFCPYLPKILQSCPWKVTSSFRPCLLTMRAQRNGCKRWVWLRSFITKRPAAFLRRNLPKSKFLTESLYDLVSDSFIMDNLLIILSSTWDKISELKTSCWSKWSVHKFAKSLGPNLELQSFNKLSLQGAYCRPKSCFASEPCPELSLRRK